MLFRLHYKIHYYGLANILNLRENLNDREGQSAYTSSSHLVDTFLNSRTTNREGVKARQTTMIFFKKLSLFLIEYDIYFTLTIL